MNKMTLLVIYFIGLTVIALSGGILVQSYKITDLEKQNSETAMQRDFFRSSEASADIRAFSCENKHN